MNVDSVRKGYMWAIEYGPPSEDARPLTGILMLQVSHRKAATGRNYGECGSCP
ncbi:hypothetical protein PanWU01x14_299990 [Parasponia andersonii]|uniref:Uncharacterized protein n=1 Tax=Parasponia andersonii TaxID=3476 RepID=A0A2P5AU39_PARAD|nr:hypothetical protein PanWU01x14_299990 [Parasponia andersonii]